MCKFKKIANDYYFYSWYDSESLGKYQLFASFLLKPNKITFKYMDTKVHIDLKGQNTVGHNSCHLLISCHGVTYMHSKIFLSPFHSSFLQKLCPLHLHCSSSRPNLPGEPVFFLFFIRAQRKKLMKQTNNRTIFHHLICQLNQKSHLYHKSCRIAVLWKSFFNPWIVFAIICTALTL